MATTPKADCKQWYDEPHIYVCLRRSCHVHGISLHPTYVWQEKGLILFWYTKVIQLMLICDLLTVNQSKCVRANAINSLVPFLPGGTFPIHHLLFIKARARSFLYFWGLKGSFFHWGRSVLRLHHLDKSHGIVT